MREEMKMGYRLRNGARTHRGAQRHALYVARFALASPAALELIKESQLEPQRYRGYIHSKHEQITPEQAKVQADEAMLLYRLTMLELKRAA